MEHTSPSIHKLALYASLLSPTHSSFLVIPLTSQALVLIFLIFDGREVLEASHRFLDTSVREHCFGVGRKLHSNTHDVLDL